MDRAPAFPGAAAAVSLTRTDLNGGGIRVNFLVNYGWEWDLAGLDRPGPSRRNITESLRTRDISRVDLVIRWGGMRRLSGFLPVQAVYADFYVVDRLWPDFQPEDFAGALAWYQKQDVTPGRVTAPKQKTAASGPEGAGRRFLHVQSAAASSSVR